MRNVGGVQGQERVYVPDVEGEPIRVILRNPTEADKRRYRATLIAKAKQSDGTPSEETVALEALRMCVVRVEDYTRDSGSGAVPIATADDMMTYGEHAVVDDVIMQVISAFAMVLEQKKRPAKRSDSSSPETRPSAIAATASPQGSAAQAAVTTREGRTATSL